MTERPQILVGGTLGRPRWNPGTGRFRPSEQASISVKVGDLTPHDCGLCDGPLAWLGREGDHDSWRCLNCGWEHTSKDCCNEWVPPLGDPFEDLLPSSEPMPPRRVLLRDPTLPHQIQLNYSYTTVEGRKQIVVVNCNCGRLRRIITDATEALGYYRDHLTAISNEIVDIPVSGDRL